jgi:hypothetical protein
MAELAIPPAVHAGHAVTVHNDNTVLSDQLLLSGKKRVQTDVNFLSSGAPATP